LCPSGKKLSRLTKPMFDQITKNATHIYPLSIEKLEEFEKEFSKLSKIDLLKIKNIIDYSLTKHICWQHH
jgi:replication initiation and membrane attachment protein DnaB